MSRALGSAVVGVFAPPTEMVEGALREMTGAAVVPVANSLAVLRDLDDALRQFRHFQIVRLKKIRIRIRNSYN